MSAKRIYRVLFESGAPVSCQVISPEEVKDDGAVYIEAMTMAHALRSASMCRTRGLKRNIGSMKLVGS